MKSQLFRALIFGAFVCLGSSSHLYAANSLIVGTLVSDPTDAQTGVRVEKGLKGIRVQMRWVNDFGVDQPGGFPIGISAASVTVTINGTTNNCALNQISPAVGTCGFVSGPFGISGPVNTVIIYFNGTFPPSASVQVAVSGVKAFDGTFENVSNNTINFTAGTNTPRTAASLELVFDISGSMGMPVATADAANPSPKQRIAALQDSADELFALMGSHAMLGDKIGQLFFSSTITGSGNLIAAHDPANLATLKSEVDGKGPTDSTGMGMGLNAGAAKLAGDTSRKFLFLFSDGEQNVPPPSIDDPVPAAGIKVGGVAVDAGINVCTITMGVQTAIGYRLQDQIAAVGCPKNKHSLFVNAGSPTFAQADLDSYFAQALTDVLIGDKLEIVKDINGSVASGATDAQKFLGNSLDTAMSILVSWDGGRQFKPQLKLIAPNGTAIDLNGNTQFGFTRAIIDLSFPLHQGGATISPKGQWELDITSPSSLTAAGGGTLNYHLMVISDNETIATDSTLNIQDPGTGEPIPINVTVKDGGSPVTGATVSAILLGPDNGLGDILAKATNPSGTPNTNGDLVGSAANGKLLLLLQDPNFLALLKNHSLPLVVLSDPGNTGTYTGTLTNALKEGHYQFLINIRGTSAGNGDFERTRKLTVFVRPKPDPGNTGLTVVSAVTQTNGAVLVHLRATPKDRFGSFLGPDYLPQLDITCSPCTVSTPITDDLRGSYDVTYQVASASTNPTIGVVVLGQNVTQTTLGDLKNPGGKWVASFHIGGTIPHANLGSLSSSISVGADLEYRLTNMYSLETYFGYDRFSASVGNDFRFINLSERFKATFGTGQLRPFVFAGLGGYFGSVAGNHSGINTGAGVQYWLTSKFAVEGSYTFHTVFISGGNATYSTLLGGVRYVFK
jgi:hypothetical protein